MKTILVLLWIAIVSVAVLWHPTPLPHLDPPVIVGHNECGSKLDTATVAALFDTIGYDFRMESVGRCEKAFYMYHKRKPKRDASWSKIKRIGGGNAN